MSALKSINPPLHTTLFACSNSRGHIQGHYSATITERKILQPLFPFTLTIQATFLYTFVWKSLCTYTHRQTHTLPDGGGAVVMSCVTTGNAITAQTEWCVYIIKSETGWKGGRRAAEGRINMTLKRGGRSSRLEEEGGWKGTEESIQQGNEKEWKWMINDEKVRRRQRGGGSLPVNQITSQSFDRGLLWPETWRRITFAPAHIHTSADALSIVFHTVAWR